MFRGTAQAFAADPLSAAQHAITNGFDKELLTVQRWFICLFEHSENLDHQRQSVELFMTLSDDPGAATIDYAIRHHSVIKRFGRFPHRNQILSRATTLEEAGFLSNQVPRFKGQGKVRIVEKRCCAVVG